MAAFIFSPFNLFTFLSWCCSTVSVLVSCTSAVLPRLISTRDALLYTLTQRWRWRSTQRRGRTTSMADWRFQNFGRLRPSSWAGKGGSLTYVERQPGQAQTRRRDGCSPTSCSQTSRRSKKGCRPGLPDFGYVCLSG